MRNKIIAGALVAAACALPSYGSESEPDPNVTRIVVVGATRNGKTTLINALHNHLVGASVASSFKSLQRVTAIVHGEVVYQRNTEPNASAQALTDEAYVYSARHVYFGDADKADVSGGNALGSQTAGITGYRYKRGEHTIEIVDTPGLGDTKGRYKEFMERLSKFLAHTYVNTIIFTINGASSGSGNDEPLKRDIEMISGLYSESFIADNHLYVYATKAQKLDQNCRLAVQVSLNLEKNKVNPKQFFIDHSSAVDLTHMTPEADDFDEGEIQAAAAAVGGKFTALIARARLTKPLRTELMELRCKLKQSLDSQVKDYKCSLEGLQAVKANLDQTQLNLAEESKALEENRRYEWQEESSESYNELVRHTESKLHHANGGPVAGTLNLGGSAFGPWRKCPKNGNYDQWHLANEKRQYTMGIPGKKIKTYRCGACDYKSGSHDDTVMRDIEVDVPEPRQRLVRVFKSDAGMRDRYQAAERRAASHRGEIDDLRSRVRSGEKQIKESAAACEGTARIYTSKCSAWGDDVLLEACRKHFDKDQAAKVAATLR